MKLGISGEKIIFAHGEEICINCYCKYLVKFSSPYDVQH